EELARVGGPEAVPGRVSLAHLGSGASLAAVREGRCIETTMGLTPTSGLVMGTRCGDIDPGLVRCLMRAKGLTIDQFHNLVNHESGLLGVSETSHDLRDLLAGQETLTSGRPRPLHCSATGQRRGSGRWRRHSAALIRLSSPGGSARTRPRPAAASATAWSSSASPWTNIATPPTPRSFRRKTAGWPSASSGPMRSC